MRLPKTKRGKVICGAMVAAQTVGPVLAWRDLAERPKTIKGNAPSLCLVSMAHQ